MCINNFVNQIKSLADQLASVKVVVDPTVLIGTTLCTRELLHPASNKNRSITLALEDQEVGVVVDQATMLVVNINPKVVANNSSRCINNLNNNINSLDNNSLDLSKVGMCLVLAITASNEVTRLEIVGRSNLTSRMANNLIQQLRKNSC
ncbi:hypothetical protein R1flu_026485 [Riccia fluitans]|uniref:Uncharacterized protein n=1 Tax=Riccia fluitans TaxID=41844 RepID=A0ABD1XG29_9MARC